MAKNDIPLDGEVNIPYRWEPRDYQQPLWYALEDFKPDSGGVARFVSVCHRRWGKDLLGINWCALASTLRVGTYWHMLPTLNQGRRIVWDGMTRDGRRFLDYFPGFGGNGSDVGREGSWITGIRKDEMSLEFENGSKYQVVGADADKLVGSGPLGIIMSEFSLYESAVVWNRVRSMLRENGGWCLWLYTPRGHNHGFALKKIAQTNKSGNWFYQLQTVEDSIHKGKRMVTEEDIQEERDDGMPEETIQQDYMCSFETAMVGSFYGDLMKMMQDDGRICRFGVESNIAVDTFWDIGMHDGSAIWFFQRVGRENHLIDCEFSSDVGLEWYANMLGEKQAKRNLVYGEHLFPHDMAVRELGVPDQRTRLDSMAALGYRGRIVKKHAVKDGINAVRQLLQNMWIEEEHCEEGIEALKGYIRRIKEGETDAKGNPIFYDDPEHNWASHYADALRIGAMGLRSLRNQRKTSQTAPENVGQFV